VDAQTRRDADANAPRALSSATISTRRAWRLFATTTVKAT
jgi:hypothetical protein